MTQKTVNRLTIAVAIAMFFTAIFVLETMVVALVPSTSKAAFARLPHRLSLDLFRVAACVGDPSGCDLRDAALGAGVELASPTAQRPDRKRQTRSRPSSSMTIADLLSLALT